MGFDCVAAPTETGCFSVAAAVSADFTRHLTESPADRTMLDFVDRMAVVTCSNPRPPLRLVGRGAASPAPRYEAMFRGVTLSRSFERGCAERAPTVCRAPFVSVLAGLAQEPRSDTT